MLSPVKKEQTTRESLQKKRKTTITIEADIVARTFIKAILLVTVVSLMTAGTSAAILSLQTADAQMSGNLSSQPAEPCPNPKKVSFELRGAVDISLVQTQLSMTPEERAVLTWLRMHQDEIIQAEMKWNIDRRAIAGAIAWEALYNVKDEPGSFNRWAGPGKVHYLDVELSHDEHGDIVIVPTTTAAEDAENAGYLPKVSYQERRNILSTPGGAINYIGAIMRSQADALSTAGYDISRDPTLLTFYYHSKDLDAVQQRANELIQQGRPPLVDVSGSKMAEWVKAHLSYLEEAVGHPDSSPQQDYATSPKTEKCGPQPSDPNTQGFPSQTGECDPNTQSCPPNPGCDYKGVTAPLCEGSTGDPPENPGCDYKGVTAPLCD